MDQETIQKIAAEVVRHLPSYAWVLLLVQAGIMAAAAAAGAFFGEYLKTRGKNLATKADFDSLQSQLRANTELVETIKAEVGQKDWARREWTNLRRTKLEALLEKMHACDTYLDLLRSKCLIGEEVLERDPLSELDTIATLYLPELRKEVADFLREGRTQATASLKFRHAFVSTTDGEAVSKARAEFFASFAPAGLIDASHALKEAARCFLVTIMGVDERA